MTDVKFTPADMKVLLAVIGCTACYSKVSDQVSLGQLAELAGVNEKTVRNALKKLADVGVLEREKQSGPGANVLSLPLDDADLVGSHDTQPLVGHESANGRADSPTRLGHVTPTTENLGEKRGQAPSSLSPEDSADDGSAQEGSAAGANEKKKPGANVIPSYTLNSAMAWMTNAGWMDTDPIAALNTQYGGVKIPDDDLIALLERHSDLQREETGPSTNGHVDPDQAALIASLAGRYGDAE